MPVFEGGMPSANEDAARQIAGMKNLSAEVILPFFCLNSPIGS
jgi:hypothetical protein